MVNKFRDDLLKGLNNLKYPPIYIYCWIYYTLRTVH